MTGIYKIESKKKPNRYYIGSGINIYRRKRDHFNQLNENKHCNKKLQNHFNKYGKDDLRFSVLIICEKNELLSFEQYFIDAYNPFFNICRKAGSRLGVKQITVWNKGRRNIYTPESIQKMKEAAKKREKIFGRKLSKQTKDKISIAHKGMKYPPEARRNMALSHTGLKKSDITRQKIRSSAQKFAPVRSELMKGERNHFYGKKHSQETKLRISQANKEKMSGESNPFYGRKHTLETKERMRKAWEIRKLKCTA